jgi:hypothetical protein
MLRNKKQECGFDSDGSGYGVMVGSCCHGNKILGSINGGSFLTFLR